MNLKKHIVLIILFLVVWSTHLFSQEQEYDAVYLKLLKEFTLNPDGSMDYRYQKELKLQTYRAFHNLYGETFITHNPDFQELKINEAYTIMADGKKVPVPENAFNKVLPAFCANAPAYNALREMVITHTGTERGAVINLSYTLHSASGFYPALMGNELISENEPIRDLSIRIRVPKNSKLQYRLTNSSLVPVVTEEGLFQVYTWSMKNVPAVSTEDFQKSGHEAYPHLIFSTAPDRESIYRSFVKQPAFSFVVTEEMKKAVDQIKQNNKEEIDVVLKLQEKVINEFRLYTIPLKFTGFTCRPAKDTWKSNGGTLAEKAILLTSLIKEAGIEAELVFVVKNDLFDHQTGSLLDVEDILIKANLRENGRLYLSVSSLNPQNMSFALPGKTLVSMKSNGKFSVEKADESRNILKMQGNFTLNDKKQLEGDVSVTFTRGSDPWLTMLRDQNKMKTFVTGGLTSSDLKELKIITIGPVEAYVRYQVQKEKPFRQDSNYLFCNLPVIHNGTESWGIRFLPAERETDLEIPFLLNESYELNFFIPSGMKLFSSEMKREIRNKAGIFFFELKQEGDKVTLIKSLELTKKTVSVPEYTEFKNLMDNWNSRKSRELIFVVE